MIRELANQHLSVTISEVGAELLSIRSTSQEHLWAGEPSIWARRAPVLFPVIGQTPAASPCFPGARAPMPVHGIVHDIPFEVLHHTETLLELCTEDNEATFAIYPYHFRLTLRFELSGQSLSGRATLLNCGDEAFRYDFGFHPGFACDAQRDVTLEFEHEEAQGMLRAVDGQVVGAPVVSQLDGRILRITPSTFAAGALILPKLRSRLVTLVQSGQRRLSVGFDTPDLAFWSNDPTRFVCIEPWCGLPSGARDHQRSVLQPGEARDYNHMITIAAPSTPTMRPADAAESLAP
ncbi:MAG: hypothetical protein JJ920_15180 [Roseitalea sp.]|jgi:galactose mutarotase-like enzyme|nr:hypothetical protein [Roseitalea sp.]MBO6721198.1 hypothetical protein [Roseitalea sp.]MBO6744256.1 hypothetical protein [Roseitalea sp.]